MRDSPVSGVPRILDPATWDATDAAKTTLRLSLVATGTACVFEVILIAIGGLGLADHTIVAGLIFGSALSAVLAFRSRAREAAFLVIGTLWLAAVASLVLHGVRATALPTLTVSTILAALWGGPRLALGLISASAIVLFLATGVVGQVFPVAVALDPVADAVVIVGQFVFIGALVAFMGPALRDIRQQIRAQGERIAQATEELQAIRTEREATEARYSDLVQALPDTVMVFEADGTIAEANATVEQLLGVPPSTLVGTRLGEYGLLEPEEASGIYAALTRVLGGAQLPPLTLRLKHQVGGYRWVEATTRVVGAGTGRPRVLAIVRDISDRRAAEQSRRTLEQAVEGAHNAMSLADADGRLTYVNASFLTTWGYPDASACVGRLATEFWQDPAAAAAVMGRVQRGEADVSGTLVGVRADGGTFEAELSASVILDERGTPVGMMGSFADVTARVTAERLLRQREAQLRRASRIARLGWWEVDLETGHLTWDEEVRRIHEVAPTYQPTVGEALAFYAPEDRPRVEAEFTHLLATGEGAILDVGLITAVGRRIQVRTQGEAEHRNGQMVKVFGIFQDITELHQAGERLRAAEERNRAIIESASDLIVLMAADGTILFESPSSERILGLKPEELVGRNVMEWLHPDDLPEAQRAFAGLMAGPGAETMTRLRYRHADGSWRRLETVGRNMLDVPGVQAIFAMGRDVTERERLEEHLRETQKLESLGRLAGGVAHDFNNMLTAILGYAEEIKDSQPPDSSVAQDASEILRAAGRARDLTKQLLTFARRQVSMLRVLDVRHELDGMSRFLDRLLGEDVRLVLDIGFDVGAVRMDASHLEQIIVNLAANARDAMPNGGTFTVVARAESLDAAAADARGLTPGTYVRLEVRDTGSGMTPDVIARAFDPFFTTKAVGEGTGLGLASVYGIVGQAGGQIELSSTPGAGTTFVIHLPCAPVASPASASSVEPPAFPGGPEEILVVEDDVAVRGYAERVLRDAGYSLTVAASAAEAEAQARARGRPFDLIVSDVVMPDVSGPVLVERLVAAWGAMPVLFVSGYTEERLADASLAGDRAYLPKPYSRNELLEGVRRLLDAAPQQGHSAGQTGGRLPFAR
jgi:two-component system, cell cycle sensor histidine kinase and response regulator CckA